MPEMLRPKPATFTQLRRENWWRAEMAGARRYI
jgi:hypothetical protein